MPSEFAGEYVTKLPALYELRKLGSNFVPSTLKISYPLN